MSEPVSTLALPVAGPFNLEATVRLLQRRPKNPIDRWENDGWLRAFDTAEGMRLIGVTNAGSIDHPDLRLDLRGGEVDARTLDDLAATVRWMLGLDAPPAPVAWLAEMEPRFTSIAAALRGFRPPCFPNLWATCLSVVPFQQLSLDAGIAILGRLVERFGPRLTIDDSDWFDFPSPETILAAAPDELSGLGLSRAKATALQSLARLAIDGQLDRARFQKLPTDEAMAALIALPGIGPWSASVIMLRGLRRMEVFPPGDTGTARNLTAILGRETLLPPAETSAFAARFGDRRGYLYFIFLGNRLLADRPFPGG
jgi:DNA-3-methyladenine glycosylase II